MGVACWFPMGTRNDRIVRLAAREAVLLNSRWAPRPRCLDDTLVLRLVLELARSQILRCCGSPLSPW